MVILTKFLDFVMFGTRDLGHNDIKFKKISINHHIHALYFMQKTMSKLQFNFAHFIGPILTLQGPTSLIWKVWNSMDWYFR
jgi:hypothetical protein